MRSKKKEMVPRVNHNFREEKKESSATVVNGGVYDRYFKIIISILVVQLLLIICLVVHMLIMTNSSMYKMMMNSDMDEMNSNSTGMGNHNMMGGMNGGGHHGDSAEMNEDMDMSDRNSGMMMGGMNNMGMPDYDVVNRSISNLASAKKTQVMNLEDGDKINLSIDIIKKNIAGKEIRMFGYNGQIPGPLLHVKQGSSIYVNVTNNLDTETTVHWHGLRLDNKFDGVPGVTMKTQKAGESFEYKLDFVDEGIYWYHPHVREDYQQELGLYGNMLVDSKYDDYYNKVNKEVPLILDDILIKNGDVAPFFDGAVNHAMMGRFGNIMLTNGDDDYELDVNKGDVVRFYITNVANTRTFNFTIPGVKLKLIGGDIGSYEKEEFVDSIIIAPAERYTIEAYFDKVGSFNLMNINPMKSYNLGKINVLNKNTESDYSSDFLSLRENEYVKADIDKYRKYFDKEVDAQIDLSVQMNGMKTGMGMSGESDGDEIEWEDTMNMMNQRMTNNSMQWLLIDKETGKENMNIKYKYKVGDKVKIRIYNDPNSMHPMQHPIHFHGQRFLVLDKDGVKNENLVWKDTVLVPVGSYVDILLDVTNPGEWMAHCHIAEHLQSGMMMSFKVEA